MVVVFSHIIIIFSCNFSKIKLNTSFSLNISIPRPYNFSPSRTCAGFIPLLRGSTKKEPLSRFLLCGKHVQKRYYLNYLIDEKKIVLIDRALRGLNFKCVSSDHFSLTYESVRLLHDNGIKDIVYISHQEHLSSSTKNRIRGVEQGRRRYTYCTH